MNPHLWLGKLLAARGHDVHVITVPMFLEMTERAGLAFTGVGDEADFNAILGDARLWKPLAGSKLVFHHAMLAMPLFHDAIMAELSHGPAVIVSPFHQFAARVVREQAGAPLVTVAATPPTVTVRA